MWNIGHAYCTLFGKLQCDRTDSLQSYFDLIQNVSGVPLIALLGCGCSPATEPVAEISHYEDIIHVRLWFMYIKIRGVPNHVFLYCSISSSWISEL